MRRVLKIVGVIALAIAGLVTTSSAAIAALTAGLLVVGLAMPTVPSTERVPDPVAAASPEDGTSEAPVESPSPSVTPSTVPTTEAPVETAPPGSVLAQLDALEEKGRAPKTGYDRDSFGWREDVDRNGCDTRNDILRRDLTAITLKEGTGGCVVLRGTLYSPYSGDTIAFDRANSTIDIDHVVALGDAWQTGAAAWHEQTRREFANDPVNLLAVESSLNRQKGDGDAATWLPPLKSYRCEYVSRQVAVKDKYGLWVKPAEAEAIRGVLADCEGLLAFADDEDVPATGEGDVVATESDEPTPEPEPAPNPAPVKGSGDVYYKNCDAARAAGAAPLHRGDPGYRPKMDRDGDGVACE